MVVPIPLEAKSWYELKVEVNGNDTIAYVDGEEIMIFSHEQLQENQIFDKGAVGSCTSPRSRKQLKGYL